MKILALDLGDVWVGTAISDALGILARPYKTVKADELTPFLTTLFNEESIATVVVGYPKTMRGTESEQTIKVKNLKEELARIFPETAWVLWDERLTSKRADALKKGITKEDKIQSHSMAAALILESYLLSLPSSFIE
jgi:putative Holliday junction resolvase